MSRSDPVKNVETLAFALQRKTAVMKASKNLNLIPLCWVGGRLCSAITNIVDRITSEGNKIIIGID